VRHDWRDRLEIGSVIATPNGSWRIVRRVSRKPNGTIWGITCVIQRCSWTHRAYTVITRSDLHQRGFRRIPVAPLALKTSGVDAKIQAAIRQGGCKRSELVLTCCDVEGLP
jgi:hypothetical protein